MKKIMMKALSSLIAAVMLLSVMVPAVSAIAEVHTDTQTVLNYVSLGDSMTNGLGLAGYDDTGYLEVAPEAYPARFAQWLAGGTGEIAEGQTVYTGTKGTVNLTQLATSAMRIEDLYYILDYGTENAYPGDEWTRTELLGGDSIGNMGQHKGGSDRWGSDGTPWPSVVETFQDSVANADVITLAAGNGNFGVYMLNAVLQAMGMADAGYGLDYSYATLENALCMHPVDDEKKAAIMDVYESAIELLGGYLSEDVAEIAGNRVAYTVASFMLCYEGVLNRIMELNPDAEIVLLGLMDTISSETDRTLVGDLTLGRLLRNLYGYLNDYIVSTPASLQNDHADVYGDATFYYAETESVSCLVEVLIEQLQDVDSVSRNRFVKSIIGTESDPGMIWNLLSGVELIDGMKLTYVTEEQIRAYIGFTDVEKAQYAAEHTQEAVSIAVYLAFESALTRVSGKAAVTVSTVMELGNLNAGLFAGVMSDYGANVGAEGALYVAPAAEAVAAIANSLQSDLVLDAETVAVLAARNEQSEALIMDIACAKVLERVNAELGSDATVDRIKELYGNDEAYDGVITEAVDEAKAILEEMLYETFDLDGSVEQLCMLLATPEALATALEHDAVLAGLLAMFARCLVADGMAGHPSPKGHTQLLNAITTAYESGYTVHQAAVRYMNGSYVVTDSSYYVALTGPASAYADLFADALPLDKTTQFHKMTWDTLDYEELAKADLISIGYDGSQISSFAVDQAFAFVAEYADVELRAAVKAYMYKALTKIVDEDSVAAYEATVDGMLDGILAEDMFAGKSKQPMDWPLLVGDSGNDVVAMALSYIRAELLAAGIPEIYSYTLDVVPYIVDATGFKASKLYEWLGEDAYFTVEIPVADAMMYAIESYLYSLISFQKTYLEVMVTLEAINPDATVVVLGQYNPYAGVVISLGDTTISMDDVYGTVVQGLSYVTYEYARRVENVTYVDITDAETLYGAALAAGDTAQDPFAALTDPALTYPGEAGHRYIADQLLAAMTVTCGHAYDDCADADCNLCGDGREAPGHTWVDATCTAPKTCTVCGGTEGEALGHTWADATCTEAKTCTVCGETEGEALGHTWTDATCTAPKTCTVCGETEGEALGHTYSADCDADCDTCGEARTPSDHTFGEWETVKAPALGLSGERRRVCSACGHEETETVPALLPETTEAPETVTDPVTEPEPESESVTEPVGQGGCASALGLGMTLWLLVSVGAVMLKKKEN